MDSGEEQTMDWPTGFMLIQGNRLESLRLLMTTWIQRRPLHPLENEVILVQSNGIGQWLKLALAAPADARGGGCGIAAGVLLTLPARFVWQAYGQVLAGLPDSSAFDTAPLTWRIYRLLGDPDGLAADPSESARADPLRGFLSVDADPRRRHQLAEQLANLYDQYQVYRADWLEAWQAGEDVLIRPDGQRRPVPAAQRWQPLLWRRLVRDVRSRVRAAGEGAPESSRAEIHRRFLAAAKALTPERRPAALPRRVIVFGISSLPQAVLEALEAIAHLSQIMLFVLNPSRHYWGDLIEGRELFRSAYRRAPPGKVPRDLDADRLHLYGHPLLAAWGKQGRDFIRLLDAHDRPETYRDHFRGDTPGIDLFESPGTDTLLNQLQDDILELRSLAERRALAGTIDPSRDRSLEFLVAHGPLREVEILHDRLLDAFEEAERSGRPLQPRDLLVMVPDIDLYAPHVEAVFGRLPPDHPRHIPYQLSDQGQRHRHPLLIGLATLLDLPRSRVAVSELLDLLDIPAVRARAGIAETDLPYLRRWIAGANIRWGLDARRRAGLGLPADLDRNTWAFGLRRMLLGFATGTAGAWRDVESFPEIGGLEAALVGALDRLVTTLTDAAEALAQPHRAADWVALIAGLLDDLFTPVTDADDVAILQVRDALAQWREDCERGGAGSEELPPEVVRDALLAALEAPTLSRRFLAGAVNIATLMPMRAIPFRQIWLLGMNDGDYPRSRRPADFDLMADDVRPGDRSRREDDRYLFLEALLSARERLVVSWVGRSIRDHSPRPPSVLVGQLRDHIAAGWRRAVPAAGDAAAADPSDTSGAALLAALTTEHPLQPFSRRYFEPNRDPRLFTYAAEWRAAHRIAATAAESPPRLARPILEAPVTPARLGRFLRRPVGHFYGERLGVPALGEETPIEDEEPFAPDGLGRWMLRDTTIERLSRTLARQPERPVAEALQEALDGLGRAGDLPMPPFERVWAERLSAELAEPLHRYREALLAYPSRRAARTLRLDAGGVVLEDRPSDLREDGSGGCLRLRLQATALGADGGLKWHHLVGDWPIHLAAQLEAPTRTRILGPDTDLEIPSLDAGRARAVLSDLLSAYLDGLTELSPLACRTGFALLEQAVLRAVDPIRIYEGSYDRRGERDDHPGYARFWPSYRELTADGRFADLVDRIYRPLFEHLTPVEVSRDG